MAHLRPRLALDYLLKRLEFTPVVAIQGAPQTGKSFLARKILTQQLPASDYLSLDDKSLQQLAQDSPRTFLANFANEHKLLIIDEAQKSPALFDAIKLAVDSKRRPGAFLLLGSTEFSLLQNIREILTGRLGKIRLLPLTFWETQGLPQKKVISRAHFLKFLENGGMPGMAFTREPQARADFFQDWIDLTCQRDIHQFKRLKLDSDLVDAILRLSANLEEPTLAAFASHTRANPKRVQTHVRALSELFVLLRLDPHPSGTGKAIYLPLDVGIANHLGATLTRRLHIALLNEKLAAFGYQGGVRPRFFYYRSTGKRLIHLVEEQVHGKISAFQVWDRETVVKPDCELLKAFGEKNPGSVLHLLAPVFESWVDFSKESEVHIWPWERIF
jgi:predicted AAA+ superfamily ATPase